MCLEYVTFERLPSSMIHCSGCRSSVIRLHKHRLLLLVCVVLSCRIVVLANTPIVQPDLTMKTKIAPAYFGPNAFQVPDMLDGKTSSRASITMAADYFSGTLTRPGGDVTAGMSLKCVIPLFSPRANLVVWMPAFEYYHVNEEVNDIRRVSCEGILKGWDSGDVYISTDVQLFTQQLHGADAVIRAALKTASGNTYAKARYYDAPGYFFDVAIGRELTMYHNSRVRIAASGGFLCWQTDVGRQNDAVMYGVQAAWNYRKLYMKATWNGYAGWEKDGDRPMVVKAQFSYKLRSMSIDAYYKMGLMDWPFRQLSLGATYDF